MSSVAELVTLADRVAKLDALGAAATAAEAVTVKRPDTDPNGITRRREVVMHFATETQADAFTAALKTLAVQPTAPALAMTSVTPPGTGRM